MNITNLFQALGNDVRWKIVTLLLAHQQKSQSAEGLCVCDLVTKCGIANSTMSHHLDWLRSVGLITGAKQGTWVYYRVNVSVLQALHQQLGKWL